MRKSRGGTNMLDLALDVLEFLTRQSGPVSLTVIADSFSASKATVHRHLQTLGRHGLVRQDPSTSRYQAGIKIMVLAEQCRANFDVLRLARVELEALATKTGQAASLAAAVDGELVVLDMIQGSAILDVGTKPGTRLTFHASALGKVWLAFHPKVQGMILGGPLKALTDHTIIDRHDLDGELKAIEKRGWAAAANESFVGINTIAAPVFDHRRELVASIGVTGLLQFLPVKPTAETIALVTAAADNMTRRLSSGSNA
jgi:DNA-binding IclR family transcriptional regulator